MIRRTKWAIVKLLVGILILIVVLGVGFFLGWKIFDKSQGKEIIEEETLIEMEPILEEEHKITISNIEEVLMPASELVSTKYFYKDADVYENYKEAFGHKIPFTTDKVVFTYEGTLSVGIDLTEVVYEVDNESKIITIIMPQIKVLSNEIDASSFEYPHVTDSVFNDTVMEDYTSLLSKLQEEKEAEATNNAELIRTAENNAKNVLKNFLVSAEVTKEYKVIFE